MTLQMNNKVKFSHCAYKLGSNCKKLHKMFASNDVIDVRGKNCIVMDLTSTSERSNVWKEVITKK